MSADELFAIEKLRGIGAVAQSVLSLVHLGTPIPKARVKRNRFGTVFTPTRNKNAEGDLAWAFRRASNLDRNHRQFTDTLAIVAVFYVPTWQRKDTDNLMKLVMDAGTKSGVWVDDYQVKAAAQFIEIDALNPRTVIAICPYLCSMSTSPLFTASDERISQ